MNGAPESRIRAYWPMDLLWVAGLSEKEKKMHKKSLTLMIDLLGKY